MAVSGGEGAELLEARVFGEVRFGTRACQPVEQLCLIRTRQVSLNATRVRKGV